ncbi:unnamed protein product, partial [Meganyctiphanes norvegica]
QRRTMQVAQSSNVIPVKKKVSVCYVYIPEDGLQEESSNECIKPVPERKISVARRRKSVTVINNIQQPNKRKISLPARNSVDQNEEVRKKKLSLCNLSNHGSPNDTEVADILCTVGFGHWNIWFILLISLCQASGQIQYFNSVFTNMPTDFRCEDQHKIDHLCRDFKEDFVHNDPMPNNKTHQISLSKYSERICSEYVHDKFVFASTFSKEFHLVCDKAWLSQLFQLILVLGGIMGNFFTGVSDKYGRAVVIKVTSYIYLLGVLIVGFEPHSHIVLLGRFLIGFCYPILNGAAYTLVMETTTSQYRSIVGTMVFLPFDLCTILLGFLAYYVHQWKMLHILISIPIYPLPFVAMLISESPRWLIQQGYFEEAYDVLKDASTKNRSILPTKEKLIQVMKEMKQGVLWEKSQSNKKCTFA